MNNYLSKTQEVSFYCATQAILRLRTPNLKNLIVKISGVDFHPFCLRVSDMTLVRELKELIINQTGLHKGSNRILKLGGRLLSLAWRTLKYYGFEKDQTVEVTFELLGGVNFSDPFNANLVSSQLVVNDPNRNWLSVGTGLSV
jgi:hypothetical protein